MFKLGHNHGQEEKQKDMANKSTLKGSVILPKIEKKSKYTA
jgi:hypothetical protein